MSAVEAVTNTALNNALSINYIVLSNGTTATTVALSINVSNAAGANAAVNAAYPVGSTFIISNHQDIETGLLKLTVTQAATLSGSNVLWDNLTYVSGQSSGFFLGNRFRTAYEITTGKYLTNDGTVSSWEYVYPTLSSTDVVATNFNLMGSFSSALDYVQVYEVSATTGYAQFNFEDGPTNEDANVINAAYPVGSTIIFADPNDLEVTYNELIVTEACFNDGPFMLWNNLTYVSGVALDDSGTYFSPAVFRTSTPLTAGKYLTNDGTTSSWDTPREVPAVTSTSTAVTNTALIAALSDTIDFIDLVGAPPTQTARITFVGDNPLSGDVDAINAAYPVGSTVIFTNVTYTTQFVVTEACTLDGANSRINWANLTVVSGDSAPMTNGTIQSLVAPTTGKYLTNDGTNSSWEEIDLTASADITMTIMGAY
jgi:hypothetical protein